MPAKPPTPSNRARRLLRWLYGPPRTWLGLVRYIAVYVGQGLLLALLLIPLPGWTLYVAVMALGAYFIWQSWPYIGRHTCEVCGTGTDVLPVYTDTRLSWMPWRQPVVRWMCTVHWHDDLLLRAWMVSNQSKDRPGA
jgi:hypothetical protein